MQQLAMCLCGVEGQWHRTCRTEDIGQIRPRWVRGGFIQHATVGLDLAKDCFQLAIADSDHRIRKQQRLTRAEFSAWMMHYPPSLVVMEGCGSAHYWARTLQGYGHEVRILPAQHVKRYVMRSKTDVADAAALVDASRSDGIRSVAVKTPEQQVLQQIHRLRAKWKNARTSRINSLRGMLREFGVDIPMGAVRGLAAIREVLESGGNGVPEALHPFIVSVLAEIGELEKRALGTERALEDFSRKDAVVQRLRTIPGVGLLVSTALKAAVGDIHRFATSRHLSSWLGITASEYSSGSKQRTGAISKRGDVYLRTQLIQGARALLTAANTRLKKGSKLTHLHCWALEAERRLGHNKASVVLANKLARIAWATWKYETPFNEDKHSPAAQERPFYLN